MSFWANYEASQEKQRQEAARLRPLVRALEEKLRRGPFPMAAYEETRKELQRLRAQLDIAEYME